MYKEKGNPIEIGFESALCAPETAARLCKPICRSCRWMLLLHMWRSTLLEYRKRVEKGGERELMV